MTTGGALLLAHPPTLIPTSTAAANFGNADLAEPGLFLSFMK
jgi:hypothetical protein